MKKGKKGENMKGAVVKIKNHALLEQMCGIILLISQRTNSERLKREFDGVLKGVKLAKPKTSLEIKRIDKYIISKLNEIRFLMDSEVEDKEILEITTEIGLQLLEREQKCTKSKH